MRFKIKPKPELWDKKTSNGPTTNIITPTKSNDNNRLTIYIHKDKYFNLTQGYIIQTNYTKINTIHKECKTKKEYKREKQTNLS